MAYRLKNIYPQHPSQPALAPGGPEDLILLAYFRHPHSHTHIQSYTCKHNFINAFHKSKIRVDNLNK